MENHPIPQDITGFQFKLIGNMTIKQFAYLAAGVILAWILYALPGALILKSPFILLSAGIGAGLAFLPVEGRPMDIMVANFFKALFSPTQFVYQRNLGHLWFPQLVKKTAQEKRQIATNSLSGQRLQDYLQGLPQKSESKLDDKEFAFLQSLNQLHQATFPSGAYTPLSPIASINTQPAQEPHIISMTPAAPKPPQNTSDEKAQKDTELLTKDEEEDRSLEHESTRLSEELREVAMKEKTQTNPIAQATDQNTVVTVETQLNAILKQKEILEKEIESLRKNLHLPPPEKKAVVPDTSILSAPKPQVPYVIPPKVPVPEYTNVQLRKPVVFPRGSATTRPSSNFPIPVSASIPASEFPNLVTGLIKDPRGNPLSNILVEIKDADGNPVRAFKTNGLGQFASATPLADGSYTLAFEDPRNQQKFESVQLAATGVVIQPFEVTSMDTREELRRSLFTT